MAIRFACRCGMLLVVPDSQADLVAPCPLCGRAAVARAGGLLGSGEVLAGPVGAPVPVACACGASFLVPARQAGLVAPCPACGRSIRARLADEPARTPRPVGTFGPSASPADSAARAAVVPLARHAGRLAPCPVCRTPIDARSCRCGACGAALPGRVVLPSADALALPPGAVDGVSRLALVCSALGMVLVSPGLSIAGILVGLATRRLQPDARSARRLTCAVVLGAVGLGVAGYLLPRVLVV